jgi:hypothetical protein
MTRHRTITPVVGLLLALCAATPVSAQADSLLSGYGGPGQGNQAILGSALLNGPAGGGGGSASGGSASGGLAGESGSATTPTSFGAANGRSGGASGRSSANGQSGSRGGSTQKVTRPPAGVSSAYLAAERGRRVGQSGALGLTGADLLYMILALGTLTLAAVLTRRLTQTTAAGTHR